MNAKEIYAHTLHLLREKQYIYDHVKDYSKMLNGMMIIASELVIIQENYPTVYANAHKTQKMKALGW